MNYTLGVDASPVSAVSAERPGRKKSRSGLSSPLPAGSGAMSVAALRHRYHNTGPREGRDGEASANYVLYRTCGIGACRLAALQFFCFNPAATTEIYTLP